LDQTSGLKYEEVKWVSEIWAIRMWIGHVFPMWLLTVHIERINNTGSSPAWMDLPLLLVLAAGLGMDSFASSLACGSRGSGADIRSMLKVPLTFGAVQGLLTIIGWVVGAAAEGIASRVDHWIAFVLLLVVGSHMVLESLRARKEGRECRPLRGREIVIIAVATSIDASVVGASMGLLGSPIMLPAIVIGCVTVVLSIMGIALGNRISRKAGTAAEIGGGIIIILIGVKVLIEHLFLD